MSIIGGSRFLLVEKPLAYPFLDIVTKTSDGPLFDLSVDLDNFEGVPYVRAAHVEEMARTLGMATKEEVDALNERIRELEAENTRLPEKSKELVDGINLLVADYHRSILTPDEFAALIPGAETPESNGESDGVLPVGDKGPDRKSSGKPGPANKQSSGKSGSNFREGDRDDFEVHDLLNGIDRQDSGNAGDKGPDSIPAGPSDEFGFN